MKNDQPTTQRKRNKKPLFITAVVLIILGLAAIVYAVFFRPQSDPRIPKANISLEFEQVAPIERGYTGDQILGLVTTQSEYDALTAEHPNLALSALEPNFTDHNYLFLTFLSAACTGGLSVESTVKEDDHLTVYLADSGCGICLDVQRTFMLQLPKEYSSRDQISIEIVPMEDACEEE